jgi:ABC-2 type transport system permease protein
MKFRRVGAVVLRQGYLIRGSLSRVIPLFAWVALDMVLWGFITKYLGGITRGFNFVSGLLGAVLFWDFMTRVMQGVTTAFFEDVWTRNFLNLFATPLTLPEYLSGLVLSSLATSTVGLTVMLALALAVFKLPFFSYGLAILPFMFVLILTGLALGVLGSAVVLRLGPAAEWFIWPIPALLSPFAGVFYPLATLPAWMQGVARFLPPAYVFENLRALAAGRAMSWSGLLAGGVLALLCLLAAGGIFFGVYRYAVRSGLFARFSAESVS